MGNAIAGCDATRRSPANPTSVARAFRKCVSTRARRKIDRSESEDRQRPACLRTAGTESAISIIDRKMGARTLAKYEPGTLWARAQSRALDRGSAWRKLASGVRS